MMAVSRGGAARTPAPHPGTPVLLPAPYLCPSLLVLAPLHSSGALLAPRGALMDLGHI